MMKILVLGGTLQFLGKHFFCVSSHLSMETWVIAFPNTLIFRFSITLN